MAQEQTVSKLMEMRMSGHGADVSRYRNDAWIC